MYLYAGAAGAAGTAAGLFLRGIAAGVRTIGRRLSIGGPNVPEARSFVQFLNELLKIRTVVALRSSAWVGVFRPALDPYPPVRTTARLAPTAAARKARR